MPAAARSGAVSPVGLLNFSHWQQTRPPSVGADVAGVGAVSYTHLTLPTKA